MGAGVAPTFADCGRSDCRVGELIEALGEPQPLVSYHLCQLRTAKLVTVRASSFDARATCAAELGGANNTYAAFERVAADRDARPLSARPHQPNRHRQEVT